MYIILKGCPTDGKTTNVPDGTYEWLIPVGFPLEINGMKHLDISRPQSFRVARYQRTNIRLGQLDGTYPVVFTYQGDA